jgi:hypothetical protein
MPGSRPLHTLTWPLLTVTAAAPRFWNSKSPDTWGRSTRPVWFAQGVCASGRASSAECSSLLQLHAEPRLQLHA